VAAQILGHFSVPMILSKVEPGKINYSPGNSSWRALTDTFLAKLAARPHSSSLGRFPFYQVGVDFRYLDGFCYAEELKDFDLNPRQIQLIPRKSMPR
jgi:hypothetical protein